jgi:hypothetical protein
MEKILRVFTRSVSPGLRPGATLLVAAAEARALSLVVRR